MSRFLSSLVAFAIILGVLTGSAYVFQDAKDRRLKDYYETAPVSEFLELKGLTAASVCPEDRASAQVVLKRHAKIDIDVVQVTSLLLTVDGSYSLIRQREAIDLRMEAGEKDVPIFYDLSDWNPAKIDAGSAREGAQFVWQRVYTVLLPGGVRRSAAIASNPFHIYETCE